jgi:hypothetical protein
MPGAHLFVRARQRQRIVKDRHRLLEGKAMLREIALRRCRVPVEFEAHGSEFAAEGAVLEGGEEGVC